MNTPDFDNLDDELQPSSNPSPQSNQDSENLEFPSDEISNTDDTLEFETGDTWASLTQEALDSTDSPQANDALTPEYSSQELSLQPETAFSHSPTVATNVSTSTPETASNELKQELASVRAELNETKESELAARATIEELEAAIQSNSLELAEAKHNSDSNQRELEQAMSTIKRLKSELDQIASERLISERTNALVTLGLESNLSFETATKFANLNADEFETIVRFVRSASPTN